MNEEDMLRYDLMVEAAMRGVVRQSLEEVIRYDLPDERHFYITFLTDYPGVSIPGYLRDRYPGEMTIVLQKDQYSELSVDADKMSVILSFNNVPERLTIPLGSISIFADPLVNFALQFKPMSDEDDTGIDFDDDPDGSGGGKSGGREDKTGEVVSLDQFRKK